MFCYLLLYLLIYSIKYRRHTIRTVKLHSLKFYVVHRHHFAQSRLSTFSPETSPTFEMFSRTNSPLSGTFLFGYLSRVYNRVIKVDPVIAVFGVVLPEEGLTK